MTGEREVKKENDAWGAEKSIIYENGKKVGEFKFEERGGFFGYGGEKVKVEYDTNGKKKEYSKQEVRGRIFGFASDEFEVRYSKDGNELGRSTVERRDTFFGMGGRFERVERDAKGNEISTTFHERRGGIFGIGSERVRVTRYKHGRSDDVTSIRSYRQGGGRWLNLNPVSLLAIALYLCLSGYWAYQEKYQGGIRSITAFVVIQCTAFLVVLYLTLGRGAAIVAALALLFLAFVAK